MKNQRLSRFSRTFPALTASLIFSCCATLNNAWSLEIRVGVVTDQSGLNGDLSRDYLAGARTFFDHTNAVGGINGRKIAVITKDDEGRAANTISLTRELIEKDKVDILFGYMGDEGLVALSKDPTFKASKVTLYAPLSGIELANTQDHIYFVRPSYREEAKHMVQHFGLLGNTTFAIVATDNTFGITTGNEIAEQLKMFGYNLVNRSVLDADLKNIDIVNRELTRIKAQVVVIAADTIAAAEFLKRFRPLNKGANVVGFSTVNHRTLIELATPDFAESTMLTQVVPHPGANQTKLQAEHRALMKKYRDEPPSHVTLEGFVAAKGLVRALERAMENRGRDLSRSNIATALSGEKRFDLDGMTLIFTPKNDRGSHLVDLTYLRKTGKLVQ